MNGDPNKVLKYAVDQIVQSINKEAMSPQEAVVKVAKELDLNVHFIKRAAEAINIVLHYNHFKKNANDKAADFPIVDSQKVAEEIFGVKNTKTASELRSEWFSSVSDEDSIPNFNRILHNPKYKQAIEEIMNAPEKHVSFDTSLAGLLDKSANYVRNLAKDVETAKTNLANIKFATNRTFCSLTNSFAKEAAARTAFEEFESQCYSLYGDRVLPYIDFMHKEANIKEERGVHDKKYTLFNNCKEAEQMGRFLELVDELNKAEAKVKEAQSLYTFEKDYYERIIKESKIKQIEANRAKGTNVFEKLKEEAAREGETFEHEKAEQEIHDPVLAQAFKKKAEEKQARDKQIKEAIDYMDSFMGNMGERLKGESSPGSAVPSTSDKDNLDRKLMVQELAVTDPILSSVDPHKVVGSYEQLLHLAPELSKEKELVRAQLRQMVTSQAIGPYESSQLIDANTKYLAQKMMQEGKLQPKPKF